MDHTYQINVAKTQFRESYNQGNVEQLLSVFADQGFTDLSEGSPNLYGEAAREGLRERAVELFAKYSVRLAVIIIDIIVTGDTAYDYGWHEFTLTPKDGGETMRKRHRYLEVWQKDSSGEWKISSFMNNLDVREELGGHASHWFLSEEKSENSGRSMST